MFMLTEAQLALKREVRAFVDSEITPHTSELDRTGVYPRDIIRKISAHGWWALAQLKAPSSLRNFQRDYVLWALSCARTCSNAAMRSATR